jgi:hypothetical protein
MGFRDDWQDPGPLDAFRGLMNCQDDNSYYAAVKGFSMYVSDVQRSFEDFFTNSPFKQPPIRLQNLTQETADYYNNTGCYGAKAGPPCVVQGMAGIPLNPNLSQFQLYCLNNCVDPYTVQSGGWESAGDKIRQIYKDMWQKFIEAYPPQPPAASSA